MNCSATLASLALLLITASAGGTPAAFHDTVARMQYAVFTADAGSLQHRLDELQALPAADRPTSMQDYQLAYGYWQLAQLHAVSQTGWVDGRMQVWRAARRCTDHADQALGWNREMAEAHALLAVCRDFSRRHPGGGSEQCARSDALATALSLAPANPRVSFIATLCRLALDGTDAREQWLNVVARFEALPAVRTGEADWGRAEALTMLGEAFLARGEAVAARDALERALLLAPGFVKAQRLLSTVLPSG